MDAFRLLPPRASNHAPNVDHLTLLLLAVTVFFTLLIATLVIYFAVRYRRRAPAQPPVAATADHSRGGILLEITWTVIPLGLTAVMFVLGARQFVRMSQPPKDSMEIYVVGKRWMWKVQHPSGGEINELHVPTGRPIKLTMISQDVIHDFGLPAFRTKQDVLPNRYTTEWFEATAPGEYRIFCDQYCGAFHAHMVGKVTAMEPAQYEAWLAGLPALEPPKESGEKLFAAYGCVTCHATRAPSMAGLYGRDVHLSDGTTVVADDNYLRESILSPTAKLVAGYPPIMPSYQGQLTEEQVMELVAYIKSMAGATTDPMRVPATAPGAGGPGSPATQPQRAVPGPRPFQPAEGGR